MSSGEQPTWRLLLIDELHYWSNVAIKLPLDLILSNKSAPHHF